MVFGITELDPGGAERCLVELVTRLDRQRFAPVVYCLGPRPVGNPTSLADRIEQAGITLHTFGARGWLDFPRVRGAVRRQLTLDRPRIVQSFLFHANVLLARAAHAAGVPHTISGIRVAERRWGVRLRLEKWTDRWIERHVCVSQQVRDFAIQRVGLPPDKLVVIPNGVDVDRFAQALPADLSTLGLTERPRHLLACIGRLERQKGFDRLLEQLPEVLRSHADCHLLIVGVGPEEDSLRHQVAGLGLQSRVHFLGFRHDVPQIMAASDLIVIPSRWEGMANVMLEGMAAGRPLVATEVEGVREALGPLASEQTVAADAPRLLGAKIVRLLATPDDALRLGRANQQRARACFSWDAMVQSYEQLYESLRDRSAQG